MAFCSRCGTELVLLEERRGYDPVTGAPDVEHWMQCPRYPRNGLAYLLHGNHDSISVEYPLLARGYR